MNTIDVIKTELVCVQRDCCRIENQCSKCDLVLPLEEIVSAYKTCINVLEENAKLKAQIEKIKCCQNCENWNWKHSRCEKKLKGDCFKQSKWVLRKILSKEYE